MVVWAPVWCFKVKYTGCERLIASIGWLQYRCVILGLQNGLDVNSNRLEGCEAWDFARLQNFILDT